MHMQNLKFLASQFGLLFIENRKKSVTKDRSTAIYIIIVLQLLYAMCVKKLEFSFFLFLTSDQLEPRYRVFT